MINTLDLDEVNKEQLQIILTKIRANTCCLNVNSKPSNSKGYHVKIECSINCDICRLVFDDDKRFAVDSVMPLRLRDFLFNDKVYFKKLEVNQENLEKIKEKLI